MKELNRITKIGGHWYIETRTGYDGPFENELEANQFLSLLKCADAARNEFAGLQFTPCH